MSIKNFSIRIATEKDTATIFNFIKELAEYEKLSHEVVTTEDQLKNALFGNKEYAKVLIASLSEEPVGFALYFYNFSTFLGRPGIYLEDLYVKPVYRGSGYGKALLAKLAQIAMEEECGRVEWSVLNWNKPAIDFYKSIGAGPMDEWTAFRLTGSNIQELANTIKKQEIE